MPLVPKVSAFLALQVHAFEFLHRNCVTDHRKKCQLDYSNVMNIMNFEFQNVSRQAPFGVVYRLAYEFEPGGQNKGVIKGSQERQGVSKRVHELPFQSEPCANKRTGTCLSLMQAQRLFLPVAAMPVLLLRLYDRERGRSSLPARSVSRLPRLRPLRSTSYGLYQVE